MMETILFSFILVLIIIWMMLGILYFYMRYVSPYDFIIKKKGKSDEDSKKKEATTLAPAVLVVSTNLA